MLNSVSSRKSNEEATLDAHNQRQDFQRQRHLARLARNKGPTVYYVRVAWIFTISGGVFTDTSIGELVSSAGVTTGTQVVVDGIGGLSNCRPTVFGDAFYECTKRTINATTVYVPVRVVGGTSASINAMTEMQCQTLNTASSSTPALGLCYPTVGSTVIKTTVVSVAYTNAIPAMMPKGAAVGYRWDCAGPDPYRIVNGSFTSSYGVLYSVTNPSFGAVLYPDILRSGRMRGGSGWSTGAAITGLSVDYGEAFDLDFFLTTGGSGGSSGNVNSDMTYSHAVFRCNSFGTAGTNMNVVGGDVRAYQQTQVATNSTPGFGGQVTSGGTVHNNDSSTSTYTFATMGIAGSHNTILLTTGTFTFTVDATTGRLTGVSVSFSSYSPDHYSIMVKGGRGAWGAL